MLYRLVTRLGLGGSGEASVQGSEGPRRFCFRGANTQFHSLYLPQFAGGYEPETQLLIQILTGANGAFFDVGANWGHLSIALAITEGFHGEIHAFEPAGDSFRDLYEITQQTSNSMSLTCHQLALSDTNGIARLSSPDRLHSGLARLTGALTGEIVSSARLDDLDLVRPTAIKLDVEGGEHRALLGAQETLKTSRPYVILETWRDNNDSAAALKLLEEAEYQLYEPFLISADHENDEVFRYGRPIPLNKRIRLALTPFTAANRCAFSEHFNALACPAARLGTLKRKFAAPSVSQAMEI